MSGQRRRARAVAIVALVLGAIVVAGYWYSTRPSLPQRPWAADMCNHDMARQMMAEQLAVHGGPGFSSDRVMAPFGMATPFYAGWNVERDWIGALVWARDREFPFYWAAYGISLAACFLVSGFILRRMGIGPVAAWAIACAVTVLNVPRHSKLWHHADNVMLHWTVAGFFLDAWIWQRFVRERRWSLHLEGWRAVTLAGMLWTMGYTWGPSMLVFEVTRTWMAVLGWRARGSGTYRVDFRPRHVALPLVLALAICVVDFLWFVPLARSVRSLDIVQGAGFHAWPDQLLRPLFIEKIADWLGAPLPPEHAYLAPETVAAVGWTYWIPFALAIVALGSARAGGDGLRLAAPFVGAVVIIVAYVTPGLHYLTVPLFWLVPFLRFFRTACRFSIYLPWLLAITAALAWPELRALAAAPRWRRQLPFLGAAFAGIVLVEGSLLARSAGYFPSLPPDSAEMFAKIKELPGDTVLSLPFCIAGANGLCTAEQCPGYPRATVGHCTRLFHDKKVYGSYTSRMLEEDCALYRRTPYQGWHAAWRENRCFGDNDWQGLCAHLRAQPNISAVLVLPDVWKAAAEPECAAQLEAHLGPPLQEITLPTDRACVGGTGGEPIRIRWYGPHCR